MSRRTALQVAGASTLWLVTGCASGAGTPPPRPPASRSADEALLDQARQDLAALLALATAISGVRVRRTRPLAVPLAAVVSRLSTRLAALGAAAERRTGTVTAPGSNPDRALQRLLAATGELQRTLRAAGSGAHSGDLARLLASVAAGLAQDAAVLVRLLPESGTGPGLGGPRPADAGLDVVDLPAGDTASVDAAQQVLAGEHAAVYAYEVVGGRRRSSPPDRGRATRAYVVHRARRDALTVGLRAAGADPVVADATYELPVPVTSTATARSVSQQVEDRCSVLYALLVATAPADRRGVRAEAGTALTDAALRLLSWGGPPTALPGVQRP